MTNDMITQAKNEISPLASKINALKVTNQETRQQAIDLRDAIKEGKKNLEEKFKFKGNTAKAHEAWKAAKATENAVYNPIDDLEMTLKGKVNAYDRQVALEAEKARKEAEAKAAEKERKEREKLEKKAEELLEKGKTEQAEAVLEQAEEVQFVPDFTPPAEKTKKLITKAEVVNMLQLCRSIADGLVPTSVIEVKQSGLNAWAKGMKVTDKVPGIKLTQDVSGRI